MERQHAIVIGAGMAGLSATRILADHFERVTVLDRDSLPDDLAVRRGVPQGHHVHVLLRQGYLTLEKLFPGLADDLDRAGAPLIDWTHDLAWYTPAGWGPRFPSGFTTRTCSRSLLEGLARRRAASLPNVAFTQSRGEGIHLPRFARIGPQGRPDRGRHCTPSSLLDGVQ